MDTYWLWLATRHHLGSQGQHELLETFPSAERIYAAGREEYAEALSLSPQALESLLDKDLSGAHQIRQQCRKLGVEILCWDSPRFPDRLKRIPDPPVVLYCLGNMPDVDGEVTIGVVGTRKATPYGMTVAREMGYQIACGGGVLISGLADGIDGAAMRGALEAKKKVIGVLGFGPDIVYPRSNEKLFQQVRENGCLLSEYPPGTRGSKWTFPQRNRIISGLSLGVLVVEAPDRSGALITAHHAAEQGRDVFCVPGPVHQESCAGSNQLLRDRLARVATCGGDVLEEYEAMFPGKVSLAKAATTPPGMKNHAPEAPKAAVSSPSALPVTKINIDKDNSGAYIDLNKRLSGLSSQEQQLVQLISGGSGDLDRLLEQLPQNPQAVLGMVTMLELKGILRRDGDRISLNE